MAPMTFLDSHDEALVVPHHARAAVFDDGDDDRLPGEHRQVHDVRGGCTRSRRHRSPRARSGRRRARGTVQASVGPASGGDAEAQGGERAGREQRSERRGRAGAGGGRRSTRARRGGEEPPVSWRARRSAVAARPAFHPRSQGHRGAPPTPRGGARAGAARGGRAQPGAGASEVVIDASRREEGGRAEALLTSRRAKGTPENVIRCVAAPDAARASSCSPARATRRERGGGSPSG